MMLETAYIFIHPRRATITKESSHGEIEIPRASNPARCSSSFMFHNNRLYIATGSSLNIQIPSTFPYEIVFMKMNPRDFYYQEYISGSIHARIKYTDPNEGFEKFVQERLNKSTKELLDEILLKRNLRM